MLGNPFVKTSYLWRDDAHTAALIGAGVLGQSPLFNF